MTIKDFFKKNTAALEIVTVNTDSTTARLFDITERNKQQVGTKVLASIPVECIEVDETFQRTTTYKKNKLKDLINHFDVNKMDALIVSVHRETKTYSVINGMHRLIAGKTRGLTEFVCEIKDFGDDPIERLKKEIRYFVGQDDDIDRLTLLDRHKANVKLGVPEDVALDNVVNRTDGVTIKNNIERVAKGRITGMRDAIAICKEHGEEHFQNIVDVIIAAEWNKEPSGFGNDSLNSISSVLWVHREDPRVKAELAKQIRKTDPVVLFTRARSIYENRKPSSAKAMYLEDMVCNALNIPRLIDPEVKVRFGMTA